MADKSIHSGLTGELAHKQQEGINKMLVLLLCRQRVSNSHSNSGKMLRPFLSMSDIDIRALVRPSQLQCDSMTLQPSRLSYHIRLQHLTRNWPEIDGQLTTISKRTRAGSAETNSTEAV
jgi:hypothetical protein